MGNPQADYREGSGQEECLFGGSTRLASDRVLNGDCHMCPVYFPRRGTAEKTIPGNLGI